MSKTVGSPVPAVGVVCMRGKEVLLIRRSKEPRAGEWSLPGGRIEWGERTADAALRELREETGVEARLAGLVEVVDGIFRTEEGAGSHYVLVDFAAHWIAGEPVAGDDALEARFVTFDTLNAFGLWPETDRIIREAFRRFPPLAL